MTNNILVDIYKNKNYELVIDYARNMYAFYENGVQVTWCGNYELSKEDCEELIKRLNLKLFRRYE